MTDRRQERRREKVEVNLLVEKEKVTLSNRLRNLRREARAAATRITAGGTGGVKK